MRKTSGILMTVAALALFIAPAYAQNNPGAVGQPIDPELLSPLKPIPPSAPPTMIEPPAYRHYEHHETAARNECGLPYPCRLQAIIDRSDWPSVLAALTAAMPHAESPRREWSSGVNNHRGYVLQETEPYKPVCKAFTVVAYMGTTTGREKVTVCRQAGGEITVR